MRNTNERIERIYAVEDALSLIKQAKEYAVKFGEATDDVFGNTAENIVRMNELAESILQIHHLYGECDKFVVCFTKDSINESLNLDIDSCYWKNKLQIKENEDGTVLYINI